MPACVLLAGSSFTAHLPATLTSAPRLPSLPLAPLQVDKRLALATGCRETEGISFARVSEMVVSAVGEKKK